MLKNNEKKKSDDEAGEGKWREGGGTDRGNVYGIFCDEGAESWEESGVAEAAFSRCADLENRRYSTAIGH